ncbi:MAG: hypothetical protein PUD15_07860 [Prevotella sp.]|nr:hypothetical protein [Prevotella sp.]
MIFKKNQKTWKNKIKTVAELLKTKTRKTNQKPSIGWLFPAMIINRSSVGKNDPHAGAVLYGGPMPERHSWGGNFDKVGVVLLRPPTVHGDSKNQYPKEKTD